MTSTWPMVKLGDVADVISGQSPEGKFYNKTGVGLPFHQGKKSFGTKYLDSAETWTSQVTKRADMGDIVISVRAPVGPVNLVTEEICIGRGLAAIRPKNSLIRDFCFAYLVSIEQTIGGNEGAVFPSINRTQICELEIPLPPLDEQKRIVAKLDDALGVVEELKANTAQAKSELDALWQSALAQSFSGDLSRVKLKKLISLEYGKGLEKKLRSSSFDVPVFGANGVKDWTRVGLVEADTIIIGRKGSAGEITRFSGQFWPLDVTYWVKPLTKDLSIDYLYNFLEIAKLPQLARGVKPGINRNDVYELDLPFPPIDQQKRIVEKLDEIKSELDRQREILISKESETERLRSSILTAAFSGEL